MASLLIGGYRDSPFCICGIVLPGKKDTWGGRVSSKKSMYEILEVLPAASLEQIKAAHRRLSLKVMSNTQGMSREECDNQLMILDVALNTLSSRSARDAYDAELAASGLALGPYEPKETAPSSAARALSLVAEIERTYKPARPENRPDHGVLEITASTVNASVRSMKVVLRAIIGLSILGFVIMMGRGVVASRAAGTITPEMLKAEEKLVILEYYKKYGVRPASRAEAEFLEMENRRRENEEKAAAFEEKKRQEEYERFEEESRRQGAQIHNELARQEEYEERRRYMEEQEERRKEEQAKREEQMRIQRELDRYRNY